VNLYSAYHVTLDNDVVPTEAVTSDRDGTMERRVTAAEQLIQTIHLSPDCVCDLLNKHQHAFDNTGLNVSLRASVASSDY